MIYEEMTTQELRDMIEGSIADHIANQPMWDYRNAKIEAGKLLMEYEKRSLGCQ